MSQGHFGPEEAITLGQCRHAFHVTYIAKHSLRQLVCPEYRSLPNARFYKMVGLRNVIPLRYEYKC
jgi:hypothetical protein